MPPSNEGGQQAAQPSLEAHSQGHPARVHRVVLVELASEGEVELGPLQQSDAQTQAPHYARVPHVLVHIFLAAAYPGNAGTLHLSQEQKRGNHR